MSILTSNKKAEGQRCGFQLTTDPSHPKMSTCPKHYSSI